MATGEEGVINLADNNRKVETQWNYRVMAETLKKVDRLIEKLDAKGSASTKTEWQ